MKKLKAGKYYDNMGRKVLDKPLKKQGINTADICELAHTITEEICKDKNITFDLKEDRYGEIKYTAKAQNIFDKYFDLLDNFFRN